MDKNKSPSRTKDENIPRSSSVSKLLAQLRSGSNSSTYRALVDIRTKLLKQRDGLSKLRQSGGAQLLLDILEKPEEKWQDICLSILGNCCLDQHFRTEILQRDGVSLIGVLLQETKSSSIQNRACRTLANISLDPPGSAQVHRTEGLVETIINILKQTVDPECQQTFIRTIRLLSDTESHRTVILDLRGLKTVADFLVSDTDAVSQASLKVIDHFIRQQPTAQCALQLDLASVPKHIVAAVNNKSPGSIQYYNSLIHTMMKHECFRPGLGNSGAIQYFISRITASQLPIQQQYVSINSLCLSCKESLNRVRIRDHAGLELLIGVLSDDRLQRIHNRVISALLYFLYDEPGLNIMLKNNIINVFMKHLASCPDWELKESPSQLFNDALDQYIDQVVLVKPALVTKEINSDQSMAETLISARDPENQSKDLNEQNDRGKDDGKDKEDMSTPLQGAASDPAPAEEMPDDLENVSMQKNDAKDEFHRYSMDSPTYKEISQTVDDQTCDVSGPRSIYECHAYTESSSPPPDCWSSGSSMPCLSPYSQASYSPISNVSGYYSPDCSPKSSVSDQLPVSPPSFVLNDLQSSGSSHIYSPIQSMSYSSPPKNSSSSSLSGSKTGSNNSLLDLQYSSSEDDSSDAANEPEDKHQFLDSHQVNSDPKKVLVTNILMFLSRVSFMENPSRYLLKWCVLDGLIWFLMRNQHKKDDTWNRVHRILIRIFQSPYLDVVVVNAVPLLISLMSEECVSSWSRQKQETAHKAASSDSSCGKDKSCDQYSYTGECTESVGADLLSLLSIEAQNLYGRGVVVHALITGAVAERVKTYLSLPFLYNDVEDLKSMLSYLPGGFDLIAHLLGSKDGILLSSAVAFLRGLLHTFKKHPITKHSDWHARNTFLVQTGVKRKRASEDEMGQNLKTAKRAKHEAANIRWHDISKEHPEDKVTLICSDKKAVELSRRVLSSASDVFHTMLSGSFSEAKHDRIVISDFSSITMTHLSHYLCGKQLGMLDVPLADLIDLLRLADQYLIHSLHVDVCECLMSWLDDHLKPWPSTSSGDENIKDISLLLRASLLYSCQWFGYMCLTKILCPSHNVFPLNLQKEVIKNAIELGNCDVYRNFVSDIVTVMEQLVR